MGDEGKKKGRASTSAFLRFPSTGSLFYFVRLGLDSSPFSLFFGKKKAIRISAGDSGAGSRPVARAIYGLATACWCGGPGSWHSSNSRSGIRRHLHWPNDIVAGIVGACPFNWAMTSSLSIFSSISACACKRLRRSNRYR